MSEDEYEATEVRDQLEQIKANSQVYQEMGGNRVFRHKMEQIVEEGSFTVPDSVEIEVSLPVRERLTGKRVQDVDAIFTIGLMMGAALERDIPIDSEEEDAWRDGEFSLPEVDDDD